MAEIFQAGALRSAIRVLMGKWVEEINTTERDWSPGYKCQSRGYTRHNSRRWRLAANGVSAHEPGSTTSWEEIIDPEDTSILWRTGNTLARVEAVVGGEWHTLLLRSGRSASTAPFASDGAQNWQIEPRGFLTYNNALLSYYAIGQRISHGDRLFYKEANATGAPPGTGWVEIAGASAAPPTDSGTTPNGNVQAVFSITLTRSDSNPSTQFRVTWGTGPSGFPSTYRTEVRLDGVLIDTVNASDAYYGFSGLTPGQTYTVALQNIDTAVAGSRSVSVSDTITTTT